MPPRRQRIELTRIFGTMCLLIGLVVALVSLTKTTGATSGALLLLLVLLGIGLRIEAAILDRPGADHE